MIGEGRGAMFSPRDLYPNSVGVPSTFEVTQPESAEQTLLYDADGNGKTVSQRRSGTQAVSIWGALVLLIAIVIIGGYFGMKA